MSNNATNINLYRRRLLPNPASCLTRSVLFVCIPVLNARAADDLPAGFPHLIA